MMKDDDDYLCRSQGADFKLVGFNQATDLVSPLRRRLESSLAGWAPVPGFAALTLGSFGLATRAL